MNKNPVQMVKEHYRRNSSVSTTESEHIVDKMELENKLDLHNSKREGLNELLAVLSLILRVLNLIC